MDLSLLPTSVSDYNRQRTGARFTVRSANSPSYSLTRRPGVRKKETAEEGREGARHGTHADTNGTNNEVGTISGYQVNTSGHIGVKNQPEEKEASGFKMPTTLNQNGTANKTIPEFGTDRSPNSVFESRGRTEWRRSNVPSRSKSLDWKAGERTPVRSTRADMYVMSTKRGGDISQQAGGLEERRTGVEGGLIGRVASSLQVYNSAVARNVPDWSSASPVSQTSLDRVSRGHSLPSRFGLKGGQSILERIEKLYGSAGLGRAEDFKMRDFSMSEKSTDYPFSSQQRSAGGTFPRRFSSAETYSLMQSRMSSIWTHKDTAASETLLSPGTRSTRERSPAGRWQGLIQSRYSEEGGVNWRKGFIETGTRSLDRARSRDSVAAQIRAVTAAGGITAIGQPKTFIEESSISGFRARRASGSVDEGRAHRREEKGETNVMNEVMRERIGTVKEQEKGKEIDDGAKEKTELKSRTTDDGFETNSKKFQERLPVRSVASVRNKINQFEALTQRVQGEATFPNQMPRRAFSVPTHLSRGHDGVKKSGSAKEIGGRRDKWEGLKNEGEERDKAEEKVMRTGKKFGSDRSLSVDEVGLRLGKKETGGNDLELEAKNNSSDDFGKYSSLKSTLEIPLNKGTQRCSKKFYIDETDFSKISSPEETSERDMTASNTPSPVPSCDTSADVQAPSEITSPLSDDDKTPTDIPSNSPFILPPAQPENATPTADSENKSTSVLTRAAKTPDPDSPHLPPPLATSSHSNLPYLISPDLKRAHLKEKKRMLDLDAWIAGLNSDIKVWDDDDEDDYEDDDESTQKDEDSNYDSDSGESSVTITSNMSQSDRRSFCVSLSDLCNFAGADYESENESDEWQSTGRRSASLSSDVSALSYVSVLPTEELDRLLEDVRSLGDNNLQEYSDVQVVVLHKEVGVGLGFSMAGGVDQNKPVTVHRVFHSGIAAQQGSIREGDQVLSINGTALCGRAHWEALRILRRAKTREMGVVVLRRGDASGASKKGVQENIQPPTHTQYETGQRVCLQLQKNSRDLGFSLEGGVGSSLGNKPLTVQKIFQGGPVDMVCPGDEVVEIQGVSVVGMRRLEAWTLIRRLAPGPVDVVLHRPRQHLET